MPTNRTACGARTLTAAHGALAGAARVAAAVALLQLLPPAASIRAQAPLLTPAEWRADLEELRARLPVAHIDLFHLLPEARFHALLDELALAADTASPGQMLVGIARVLAQVGEGHTSARILVPELSGFPVLTHVQEDGLRIGRIGRAHEELLGGRVVAVEGVPVGTVLGRLAEVISADNAMGVRPWLPYYLATQEVLEGLGLLDSEPGLTLVVERLDGGEALVVLKARPLDQVESLLFGDSPDMVSAGADAPIRIRDRHAGSYWFDWLPAERTMFVRIDRLVSRPEWPFDAFVDSLFAEVERRDARRLVLDLRSLSGGNHISLPLVHGIVRSARFAGQGALFVLIGRGTFSAGQNLVTLLEQNAQPIFVGEPTAGRPNMYGVLGRFLLPNSGIEIRHSRYYLQDADPADYRHWQEPHLFAPPDVLAEMEGRDPGLEVALSFDGEFPWTAAVAALEAAYQEGGPAAALEAGHAWSEALRDGGWGAEQALNRLGYRVLHAGEPEQAVDVLRLQTELFPNAWQGWNSLGDALARAGRRVEALAAYERALALNGYDDDARRQLRLLALEAGSGS